MRVEPVDERDSSWEEDGPRYRVYLFAGPGPAFTTETYDLTETDVAEVLAWAQRAAGEDRRFSIALVREAEPSGAGGRGVVWLLGRDLNDVRPGG